VGEKSGRELKIAMTRRNNVIMIKVKNDISKRTLLDKVCRCSHVINYVKHGHA
jgi:hypothetical protein